MFHVIINSLFPWANFNDLSLICNRGSSGWPSRMLVSSHHCTFLSGYMESQIKIKSISTSLESEWESVVINTFNDTRLEQVDSSFSTGVSLTWTAYTLGNAPLDIAHFHPLRIFFLFMANCLFFYPHIVPFKKRVFRIN